MQIGAEVYIVTFEGGGFGKSSSASASFGQIGNLPLSDQCFCKLEGKFDAVNVHKYLVPTVHTYFFILGQNNAAPSKWTQWMLCRYKNLLS